MRRTNRRGDNSFSLLAITLALIAIVSMIGLAAEKLEKTNTSIQKMKTAIVEVSNKIR